MSIYYDCFVSLPTICRAEFGPILERKVCSWWRGAINGAPVVVGEIGFLFVFPFLREKRVQVARR